MFLTVASLRNPMAVTLFFAIVALLGLLAAVRMGRSILPPIALPVVSVAAVYPGAGPTEIERLIVVPMEQQIQTLPDLSRVSASAQSGIGEIVVQFRFGSNLETDRANVQSAVDAARADMPTDLVPPVVSRQDPTQAPVFEASVSSVLLSPAQLAQAATAQILPRLRAVGGVESVQSSGAVTRQFTVRPQSGALDALGATPLDVFRAVAAGNDLFPGGLARSRGAQQSVGIDASVNSVSQIARLPVAIPGASLARVGDLATIDDGYAERTVLSRADGNEAILLSVTAPPGTDSGATIRGLRRAFAELAQRYPAIRFEGLRTDEAATGAAIGGVVQTLGEGVALTVLVVLFFLHAWRNALIAAVSIPTSLCAALAAMWAMGFSLNVLSLMGLSLTIGILVDDSIVILEAISRAAARGCGGDEAALAGRKELGGAAIAITLVDVAVFLPIGVMNGIVGEFMREFAMVIVVATAFSLLTALTLTPLLSARWAIAASRAPLDVGRLPWTLRGRFVLGVVAAWRNAIDAFNAWEERLALRYAQRWLPAAIRRRSYVAACAAAICALALVPLVAGAIPTRILAAGQPRRAKLRLDDAAGNAARGDRRGGTADRRSAVRRSGLPARADERGPVVHRKRGSLRVQRRTGSRRATARCRCGYGGTARSRAVVARAFGHHQQRG